MARSPHTRAPSTRWMRRVSRGALRSQQQGDVHRDRLRSAVHSVGSCGRTGWQGHHIPEHRAPAGCGGYPGEPSDLNNKVTYIATDSARQSIPWVRAEGPDGKVTTYQSTEHPLDAAGIQESPPRRMDCIDCHNRPTHIYYPAPRSVDHLMSVGWIDPSLPSAKNLAVYALENSYASAKAG